MKRAPLCDPLFSSLNIACAQKCAFAAFARGGKLIIYWLWMRNERRKCIRYFPQNVNKTIIYICKTSEWKILLNVGFMSIYKNFKKLEFIIIIENWIIFYSSWISQLWYMTMEGRRGEFIIQRVRGGDEREREMAHQEECSWQKYLHNENTWK